MHLEEQINQATERDEKSHFSPAVPLEESTRNALVAQYAPLARILANRMAMRVPPNVCVDDLASAGLEGLLDAIEKFDPSKGVQLKTYAAFRIKGAILDELRRMDLIPRTLRKRVREMDEARRAVEQKMGGPAEDSEVAAHMGIDMDAYYDMVNARHVEILSIDSPVDGDRSNGGGKTFYQGLMGKGDGPVEHMMAREIKGVIADGIKALPQKEQMVVSLYYYDGLTLKEIGKVLDLTESRVSQIHSSVIGKLRTKLRSYFKP